MYRKEGQVYTCLLCSAMTSRNLRNVRRHIQGQHLGRRFPCSSCSYSATQKVNLAAHVRAKHAVCKVLEDDEKIEDPAVHWRIPDEDQDGCEEDLPPFKHA
jgi:hypothetical protein